MPADEPGSRLSGFGGKAQPEGLGRIRDFAAALRDRGALLAARRSRCPGMAVLRQRTRRRNGGALRPGFHCEGKPGSLGSGAEGIVGAMGGADSVHLDWRAWPLAAEAGAVSDSSLPYAVN